MGSTDIVLEFHDRVAMQHASSISSSQPPHTDDEVFIQLAVSRLESFHFMCGRGQQFAAS